ncbi:glutaredoxin [Acidiferrobacter sp. SPIII_3]|uniref:glutaredoxin family protein n=1 Tax=Acidiferrobacter sp. SPIII_3 TaxID=1281578 RepID=UPI000D72533C|nr:glutaredoxin family protein [Acidiferrobacter sp. SPIII_3]AWP22194.1 glutaredoxin [Acidiferrobacter sp. SPIII_3]
MDIIFYHRSDCHLCEDMARALAPLAAELGVAVRAVDIESDPDLEARYGLKVPVLVHGGTEICCYRLDERAVRGAVAAKKARR